MHRSLSEELANNRFHVHGLVHKTKFYEFQFSFGCLIFRRLSVVREKRGAGAGDQRHQGPRPGPQEVGRGRGRRGSEAGARQGEQAKPRGQDRVHVQPPETEHSQGGRAGEIRSQERQEISVHGHSEQEETR